MLPGCKTPTISQRANLLSLLSQLPHLPTSLPPFSPPSPRSVPSLLPCHTSCSLVADWLTGQWVTRDWHAGSQRTIGGHYSCVRGTRGEWWLAGLLSANMAVSEQVSSPCCPFHQCAVSLWVGGWICTQCAPMGEIFFVLFFTVPSHWSFGLNSYGAYGLFLDAMVEMAGLWAIDDIRLKSGIAGFMGILFCTRRPEDCYLPLYYIIDLLITPVKTQYIHLVVDFGSSSL